MFNFATQEVTIETWDTTGVDPMNNPMRTWSKETVGGVLIFPSAAMGLSPAVDVEVGSENRPDGVKTTYVVYFPKTFNKPLRGARIWVPGEDEPMKVVGDPKPYDPDLTPTDFNYVVYLENLKG